MSNYHQLSAVEIEVHTNYGQMQTRTITFSCYHVMLCHSKSSVSLSLHHTKPLYCCWKMSTSAFTSHLSVLMSWKIFNLITMISCFCVIGDCSVQRYSRISSWWFTCCCSKAVGGQMNVYFFKSIVSLYLFW